MTDRKNPHLVKMGAMTTERKNTKIMELQINQQIQTLFDCTKDFLKKQANKHNLEKNWHSVDAGVKELADALGKGYAVRSGIVTTGNNREGVTGCNWLFLDFDSTTVEDTLSVPFSDNASLWYYTPSYVKGENEKHRLVFKLDKTISADEYERIYRLLRTYYVHSDECTAPNWLFFGARCPDYVHILSETETLDTEILLQIAPPLEKVKQLNPQPPASTDKKGVRSQLLNYISESIWHGVCNGKDIDALFCLHNHGFIYQGSDKNNIAKWGGHRPEDKQKNHGTGFYVFWQQPELPPVWKNQGECELDAGTIIEYWHHYGNLLHGKDWGAITWNEDRKYQNLKLVADDLCSHFGVALFDFQATIKANKEEALTSKIEPAIKIIKENVFALKTGGKPTYVYYNPIDKTWEINNQAVEVWRNCLKPFLIDAGAESLELEIPKTGHFYKSFIEYSSDIKNIEKTDFDLRKNSDYVPLANGEYNIITKQLEPFNREIYNTRRYVHEYHETTEKQQQVIERFNKWLLWTYKDALTRQTVIDWLALNVMGLAGQTEVMLCFWGTPETGKSTIYNLIMRMLGKNATSIQGDKLNSSDNKFNFQTFDGVQAVCIEEANNVNKNGWNNIKQLTGSKNPVISIERKNMTPYEVVFIAGLTATYQDEFKIPASDDGGIRRRVIPIQHTKDLTNDEWSDIGSYLSKPENYRAIFNWLLSTIDPTAAVKRVKSYAKSNDVNDKMVEILIEQDDVLAYITDTIEFTNNEEDFVTNMELQASYKTYLQQEKLTPITQYEEGKITKISQYIRAKAKVAKNGFVWSFADDSSRVRVGGQQVRVLKGIKLKKSDSF